MGLTIIPICNTVWATTDLSTLGSPDVMISPNSGPPGTKITVTIYHIPDISKISYPYPDLYIFLPFLQPFGTTLSSHCGGEDCFPVYTHDDALNHDFTDRTITFSLPSTSNPKPVFLNGLENTICDVIVNGKTIERFSTLCNTKVEPQGLYQIKLAWMLESDSKQIYVLKTIPFIVTAETPSSSNSVADNGNTLLKEYQNGTISQAQFYSGLKTRGWTDEQIRQALAVIGKLPHQIGTSGPDNRLSFSQVNSSISSENNTSSKTSVVKIEPMPPAIKLDTNASKVKPEQNQQKNSSLLTQRNTSTVQSMQSNVTIQSSPDNSLWNGMIIGLSISAVVIMTGVVIFVKTHRNKGNNR
jgi:hypothetical protein